MEILQILKENSDVHLFKHLFNDKDKNSYTFLMLLNGLEKNELLVEIYLKYKNYINPFISNNEHNNILHFILSNLGEYPTKKVCVDKYILIIKEIISNNPNIIFTKNKKGKTPLIIIFGNTKNITGPLNFISKIFSFESLINDSDGELLFHSFSNNNLFMIRYLIEYHHLNINKSIILPQAKILLLISF